ncbi:MAG: hypothetical protein KIH63_002755 [Candidatus Saccharibacteria bacterium]|nr:hypothetical protein [Candidatus Saccharibacteria bacterium]
MALRYLATPLDMEPQTVFLEQSGQVLVSSAPSLAPKMLATVIDRWLQTFRDQETTVKYPGNRHGTFYRLAGAALGEGEKYFHGIADETATPDGTITTAYISPREDVTYQVIQTSTHGGDSLHCEELTVRRMSPDYTIYVTDPTPVIHHGNSVTATPADANLGIIGMAYDHLRTTS